MQTLPAIPMGVTPYAEAWDLQRRLHARVVEGTLPGAMLLLQHPHVFTIGRRGKPFHVLANEAQLRELGVEVHEIDRGGEVTYHGPGQLVGYPIIDVRKAGGPLTYVRSLEQAIIATLADFGIAAESAGGPTGVWVGEAKIAAIGVKVGRGVSTHGFALNVTTVLSYFSHIVPCGMPDAPVTSIASLKPRFGTMDAVISSFCRRFGEVAGYDIEFTTLDAIEPRSAALDAAG
ncbi:MAG: lipoyl(octanoyl) transferase LipB [SAR202 cluster bacterium]|nr:lipoyl(octanoyl) transferase LipB [SAR202 cluster bacterium]